MSPGDQTLAALYQDAREQVTAAREAAARLRNLPHLSPGQQNDVDTAYSLLVDLEDAMIQQDWRRDLERLRRAAGKLSALSASLRESIAELQRVGQMVGEAAKALGTLVEILVKSSAAGLL